MQIINLIKDIQNKTLIPTKIYKRNVNSIFSIEVETIKNEFISIIFKTETLRNKAFLKLDDEVFYLLPFNPNKYIDIKTIDSQ